MDKKFNKFQKWIQKMKKSTNLRRKRKPTTSSIWARSNKMIFETINNPFIIQYNNIL